MKSASEKQLGDIHNTAERLDKTCKINWMNRNGMIHVMVQHKNCEFGQMASCHYQDSGRRVKINHFYQ